MKKYLVMMMCAGLLFTATGCGDEKKEEESSSKSDNTVETSKSDNNSETSKKEEDSKVKNQVLKCNADNQYESVEYRFTFDENGEELIGASATISTEFEDDEMEAIDKEIFDSYCESYQETEKGIKSCSSGFKGNKFSLDIELDIDDAGLFDIDSTTTIDEVKEILEDKDNATCKIEK